MRGENIRSDRMSLDIAFELLGWGKDDWPSEAEVKKRHKELLLKFHPDKAPLDLVEEYTRTAARLNHAKEVILRAHGMSNVETSEEEPLPNPPNKKNEVSKHEDKLSSQDQQHVAEEVGHLHERQEGDHIRVSRSTRVNKSDGATAQELRGLQNFFADGDGCRQATGDQGTTTARKTVAAHHATKKKAHASCSSSASLPAAVHQDDQDCASHGCAADVSHASSTRRATTETAAFGIAQQTGIINHSAHGRDLPPVDPASVAEIVSLGRDDKKESTSVSILEMKTVHATCSSHTDSREPQVASHAAIQTMVGMNQGITNKRTQGSANMCGEQQIACVADGADGRRALSHDSNASRIHEGRMAANGTHTPADVCHDKVVRQDDDTSARQSAATNGGTATLQENTTKTKKENTTITAHGNERPELKKHSESAAKDEDVHTAKGVVKSENDKMQGHAALLPIKAHGMVKASSSCSNSSSNGSSVHQNTSSKAGPAHHHQADEGSTSMPTNMSIHRQDERGHIDAPHMLGGRDGTDKEHVPHVVMSDSNVQHSVSAASCNSHVGGVGVHVGGVGVHMGGVGVGNAAMGNDIRQKETTHVRDRAMSEGVLVRGSEEGDIAVKCGDDDDDEHECVLVTRRSVVPSWHVLLSNLKLLAQVRESDKLNVSGETVSLDSSGMLGCVVRWLSSQGRSQTASWLSRFSKDLSDFVQLLLAGVSLCGDQQSGQGDGYQMTRSEMICALDAELLPCVQGLKRLRTTYADDAFIIKKLDTVVTELLHEKEKVRAWLAENGYQDLC